jgi:uncharacterized protein DUF4824
MKPWYLRWPTLAGLGVIVVTNAIALGGVAFNRGAAPGGRLELTQRELERPHSYLRDPNENSGLTLELRWRLEEATRAVGDSYHSGESDWIDAAKLQELGLQARRQMRDGEQTYSVGIEKDVLLVLEMEGPAYRRVVKHACDRAQQTGKSEDRANCERENTQASRLFVVDAGLDRDALRRKYPDDRRYAIVKGRMQAAWNNTRSSWRLRGYVNDVQSGEVHVPPEMRAAVGASAISDSTYRVTLAFGRRLEPWIVSLR